MKPTANNIPEIKRKTADEKKRTSTLLLPLDSREMESLGEKSPEEKSDFRGRELQKDTRRARISREGIHPDGQREVGLACRIVQPIGRAGKRERETELAGTCTGL